MHGLGTIINVAAIIFGGVLGMIFGKFFNERIQTTIIKALGVCVIFIGISGTLEKMLTFTDGKISTNGTLMTVISFSLGSLIGEIIDIDEKVEKLGNWLKRKTGNAKDKHFVDGFVSSSLTVCIGAMAIVGSIEDGINGNYSILAIKALIDMVFIMMMTSSLGKGCIFSALPVGIIQGFFTLGATLIQPIMNEKALANLSLTGSMLIFCVGLNFIIKDKIKVANLVPTIFVAVILAFLPL